MTQRVFVLFVKMTADSPLYRLASSDSPDTIAELVRILLIQRVERPAELLVLSEQLDMTGS